MPDGTDPLATGDSAMKRVLAVCVGLGVVACVSVARAELPRHVAKPKAQCGIPNYDYRPNVVNPAPTVTAAQVETLRKEAQRPPTPVPPLNK